MTKIPKILPMALVSVVALGTGYALALRSPQAVLPAIAQDASTENAAEPNASDARLSGSAVADASEGTPGDEDAFPIHLPTRHDGAKVPALSLSPVSKYCAGAPSLTLDVVVLLNGKPGATKTISRSADKVHIRLGKTGTSAEWLFVKNPVHPERVSAALVNHQRRAILEYDDTALRNSGTAQGWADVVALGFDASSLAKLVDKHATRQLSDLTFELFEASDSHERVTRVWWNDEVCLPQELATQTPAGTEISKVVAIRRGVDEDLLNRPAARFPTYTAMDAIDWLEKVHDHGDAKQQAGGGHHAH